MNAAIDLYCPLPAEPSTGSMPVTSLQKTGGMRSLTSISSVTLGSSLRPVVALLFLAINQAGRQPSKAATTVALAWANELDAMLAFPHRVNVSLGGNIHFHFIRDRRLATVEFDEDGDVVLILSDRSQDEEAEAYEVTLAEPASVMTRVVDFLRK